jgi:MFS-type transporter involved in bile tolerance (Atg22 family)
MRETANPSPNRVPLVNLAVGILALISPWALHPASSTVTWDLVITGALIAIVSFLTMGTHAQSETSHNYWPAINVLLGIWLLVSLGFIHNDLAMSWNNVVLGVLAIITGLVSQSHEETTMRRTMHA